MFQIEDVRVVELTFDRRGVIVMAAGCETPWQTQTLPAELAALIDADELVMMNVNQFVRASAVGEIRVRDGAAVVEVEGLAKPLTLWPLSKCQPVADRVRDFRAECGLDELVG